MIVSRAETCRNGIKQLWQKLCLATGEWLRKICHIIYVIEPKYWYLFVTTIWFNWIGTILTLYIFIFVIVFRIQMELLRYKHFNSHTHTTMFILKTCRVYDGRQQCICAIAIQHVRFSLLFKRMVVSIVCVDKRKSKCQQWRIKLLGNYFFIPKIILFDIDFMVDMF